MHIAILGATSQIAKDLVLSYAKHSKCSLTLFARRPEAVLQWLSAVGLTDRYAVANIANFGPGQNFSAVLNFVGVGNPAQTAAMGASILDITHHYDDKVLAYLKCNSNCRYIFLSSGAAYGSSFDEPACITTKACFAINNLQSQDWYAMAKVYAECRHRALSELHIIDLRVFNYFSHTQNQEDRFLMSDILRAIRDGTIFETSSDNIVRDYIHPDDFYNLIIKLLDSMPANQAIDCYSESPVDKFTLLENMHQNYNLNYSVKECNVGVNATGIKINYYSKHKKAADFGYVPKFSSLNGIFEEMSKIYPNGCILKN